MLWQWRLHGADDESTLTLSCRYFELRQRVQKLDLMTEIEAGGGSSSNNKRGCWTSARAIKATDVHRR